MTDHFSSRIEGIASTSGTDTTVIDATVSLGAGASIDSAAPDYPVVVSFNEAMLNFLKNAEIFLAHPFKVDGIIPLGKRLKFDQPIFMEPFTTCHQGGFCSLGTFTYALSALRQSFIAERYCSIARNSQILGPAHPLETISTHIFTWDREFADRVGTRFGHIPELAPFEDDLGPVKVGNDVWIGQNVLMQRGITIGNGAVIAAGSVVTKDVPPFAIVGGTPARIIRYRFDDALIERVERVAWWQYHVARFEGLDVASPHRFLDGIEEGVAAGHITPYNPHPYNIPEIFQLLADA